MRKQCCRNCRYYLSNTIYEKCAILNDLVSEKEKCSFYKEREEDETKST